jgi:hypothetical protein
MDTPKDYKTLAKHFVENLEFQKVPQVHATLNRGDLLLSTGEAEVSEDRVTFYPSIPKFLDGPLGSAIVLKETSSGVVIPLPRQSQESFEVSTDRVWYFER